MRTNHLTKTDLRNTVSAWLGGDKSVSVADANAAIDKRRQMEREEFKTKRTERLICWRCGVRVPNQEICSSCERPFTIF
jgi:rRNA maturation endonuclease Nob1